MWPKQSIYWYNERTLKISIPFTWELPRVRNFLSQRSFLWDISEVGGPAIKLIPGFFDGLDYVTEADKDEPGVLQRVNPLATRTTLGCVNSCSFCAVGSRKIEGMKYRELDEWPDLPIIADNNLLAANYYHFDRVIDRLIVHGWADFNQGIDSRLLSEYHATRFAQIKRPTIRLAIDHMDLRDEWSMAFYRLISAGVKKRNISSYCLIGFDSDPQESWQRCEWVESHGVKAYPMWFHALDQLEKNIVTSVQQKAGWTDEKRKSIMGHYYKHRGNVPMDSQKGRTTP